MMKFYNRLKAFFVLGYIGFQNPNPFYKSHLKNLSKMYEMMWQVASEKHPRMTKIATVHPEDEDKNLPLISIWIGPGKDADPWERVRELKQENDWLRDELRMKNEQGK